MVAALKAKKLPIKEVKVYSENSDPNQLLGRPHQYTGKASWHDSRLPSASFDVDGGGSIESFAASSDLDSRVGYVNAITRGSSLFAEYEYSSESGLFFLRLSHYLTAAKAKAYVTALLAAFPDLKAD